MASFQAPVKAESRPVFTIERILGLQQERPRHFLKLHRPWTDVDVEKENRGSSVSFKQQQQHHLPQPLSCRPTSSWYIGRRPRTAFTNSQVKVLESVFQMNCYPGIELREQLARRLELDEDRIQIWFQNRRAKLRRSLRESRLRLVQTAVADLQVEQEIIRTGLKTSRDQRGDHNLALHVELRVEEEEERC
ncbi:homeobox expressed in ES cells 1 [Cheilinus undulatus]|uniref:homeobox expressed in ES cells 1 n=1 Tax=Cheilinus undulatus TaxID=241271 RepID=UPI001BD35A0E|nr:homeobox expressed in ES cells 1 [Cheilinus undulatus]